MEAPGFEPEFDWLTCLLILFICGHVFSYDSGFSCHRSLCFQAPPPTPKFHFPSTCSAKLVWSFSKIFDMEHFKNLHWICYNIASILSFGFFGCKTCGILVPWPGIEHARPACCCSVTQPCPTLCDHIDCSMTGFPVLHYLPEFAQTHVHGVGDAIQLSHPLSSLFPPALNLSQHQGLFQCISSLHQVAKVLELQLQHQSFQSIFRVESKVLITAPPGSLATLLLEQISLNHPWLPQHLQNLVHSFLMADRMLIVIIFVFHTQ